MTPHIRQLLAQPECVRCQGKCHSLRNGLDLRCYWCMTRSIAHVTYHRHQGRKFMVRTWEREVVL